MGAGVGAAVQFAAALVLVVAAASKLAVPRSFTATLRALRVPRPDVVRLAVPAVELAAALALVAAPAAWGTGALVVAIGLAFAGAGALALSQGEAVECACFGGAGSALGIRQLAALPAWVAAAALPSALGTPIAGPDGVVALTTATLAAAALAAGRVLARARDGRAFRLAAAR